VDDAPFGALGRVILIGEPVKKRRFDVRDGVAGGPPARLGA